MAARGRPKGSPAELSAEARIRSMLGVDPYSIASNPKQAEALFLTLEQVDVEDIDTDESAQSPAYWRQLFQVTQAVAKVKGEDAVLALEALRMQEEMSQVHIEQLEQQVKQGEPRRRGLGDTATGSKHQLLENELSSLEKQNSKLQRHLRQAESDLAREKAEKEIVREESWKQQLALEQVTVENQDLKHAIGDYQGQLQTYRSSLHDQHGHGNEERERQKLHNVQLSEELDSLRRNLVETNEKLVKERDGLAAELETATHDMMSVTGEISRLKAALKQSDETVHSLKVEKNQLITEMDLKEQTYQEKGQAEEAMMAAIDEKVDDWKQVLDRRNRELLQCKEMLERQKQELFTVHADKTHQLKLAQIGHDREEEVNVLKEKLKQLGEEMNTQLAEFEEKRKEVLADDVQQRISELQALNSQLSDQAQHDRQLYAQVNKDAAEKDHQIADNLAKIDALVNGHYGLPEAVKEVQEFKFQLSLRDEEVKEFVSKVNQLEAAVSSLEDENTELCKRLGIDRSSTKFEVDMRYGQRVTNEQEKAKARHLAREVERLESERVELKHQLLVQAMQRGERAVQLGLTTDDLIAVEEFAELLRQAERRNEARPDPLQVLASHQSIKEWKEELRQRDDELATIRSAHKRSASTVEMLTREKSFLQEQLTDFRQENVELSNVLEDVVQQVKGIELSTLPVKRTASWQSASVAREMTLSAGSGKPMSSALEELLAHWQSRHSGDGQAAVVQHLRGQIDQLVGKTSQLRDELLYSQELCEKFTAQRARQDLQIETLEADIVALRQAGAQVVQNQNSRLPEEIPLTSAEIIASLNKQLLHALDRLSLQADELQKAEATLSTVQSQTAAIVHQQGLLYEEYDHDKADWVKRESKLTAQKTKMEERHEIDQIAISRYERLAEMGKNQSDSQASYLSELSQRVIELEINEKNAKRQLESLEEDRSHLMKKYTVLNSEYMALEAKCQTRISVLQQHRVLADARVGTLSQQLENSVPISELTCAQSNLNDLSSKYRQLLNEQSQLDEQQMLVDYQKDQLSVCQGQIEDLQTELGIVKERAHKSEQLLEMADKSGVSSASPQYSSQQIAILEMKALSAGQKAELSSQSLKQSQRTQTRLEARNSQLEKHFVELEKLNLESQRQEQALRRELDGCIPASEAVSCREHIQQLLNSEASLQARVCDLQQKLDLSTQQSSTSDLSETLNRMEITSLKSQLIQSHSGTDDKAMIGKLHHHIVALEVREATAMHKLHQASTKISSVEVSLSKLQGEIDAKTECLYRCKVAAINKQQRLRHTIQMLRHQYAGCIPLAQQEQHALMLKQARSAKIDAQKKFREATEQQVNVDDQLAELQLRLSSVQELVSSLKDGTHASKVVVWHGKMEEVRLENLRQLRKIDRMDEEIKSLKQSSERHEMVATQSEEALVIQQQRHEREALSWESREAELEDVIQDLQLAQERMLYSANELATSGQLAPDSTQPVAVQLEQAVVRLKHQALHCASLQDQCSQLQKDKEILHGHQTELEQQLIHKEKIETELRIRLTGQPDDVAIGDDPVPSREKEAVRKAQDMIKSLRQQLEQKESVLLKYQSRLVQVQQECASATDEQKEQIGKLSQKLQSQNEDAFLKLKQAAVESTRVADPPLPTQKQLERLQELEDVAAEQDKTVASLLEKLEQERQNHQKSAESWARDLKVLKQQMKKQLGEVRTELQRNETSRQELSTELATVREQLDITNAELLSAQEAAHHAPNRTMKVLVDKLKQQLSTKEQQLQALIQALAQLRSDMTNMAEQQIQDKMASTSEDMNIQKLINVQTAKLKTHVEDLQARLEQLTCQAEKHSKKEGLFKENVATLQQSVRQKDISLGRQDKALKTLVEEKERWLAKEKDLMTQASKRDDTCTSSKQETTQLRARCRALQTQVEKQTQELTQLHRKADTAKLVQAQADVPRASKTVSSTEVQHWDEVKRLQQRCDTFQKKLKAKTGEVESVAKQTSSLRETVCRLERERNSLQQKVKKLSSQSTGVLQRTGTSTAETDELRHETAHLQKEVKLLQDRLSSTISKSEMERLQTEIHGLKSRLEQETSNCERLRVTNTQLERQLSRKKETKEVVDIDMKVRHGGGGGDHSATAQDQVQGRVDALELEVVRKNRMLQEVKRHLKGAAQQEKQLQERCSQLESELRAQKQASPASVQETLDDLHAARAALHTSEDQQAEVMAELVQLRKQTSSAHSRDVQQLQTENAKMQAELAALNPQFFDELEDLKFNYQQATQLNEQYKIQLRQFGVEC